MMIVSLAEPLCTLVLLDKSKTPPKLSRATAKKKLWKLPDKLLLRRLRWSRRSGGFRRSRSRLGSRTRLNGIRLVIEADDVLRHVDLIRRIKDWRILTGGVQNDAEAILARIAVKNVYHFAADALEHFLLCGARVFLKITASAIEALRKPLALGRQARFFLLAQLSLACLELLLQITDLLRHIVDFGRARSELRLQFSGRLLAFCGVPNPAPHIDYAHRPVC